MEYEEEIVKVCNDALIELGQKVPIKHLEACDDIVLSPNELVCASKFPESRRSVLKNHKWNFATRVQMVNCINECSMFDGWRFKFKRPSNCMTICDVSGYRAFEVMGDWVYVREPVRGVKYIEDVVNPAEWDTSVRQVLVRRLAADIAIAISGGQNMVQLMEQRFALALGDAKKNDASEGREVDFEGLDPISLSMECAIEHFVNGGNWGRIL